MGLVLALLLGGWRLAAIITLVVLIVILLLLMLWRKVVTVPSLTLTLAAVTPPGQYDHGATVNFSGVDLTDVGVPASGDTVNLTFLDSAGVSSSVGSVQAGTDGSFSGSFVIPASAAPGSATVTATDPKTGATASQTLTRKPRQHPSSR